MRANQLNLVEGMERTDKLYSNIDPYKREKLSTPLISVIIPLYNEEKTIRSVVERIPNHRRYEIIIVDDGSTDKSLEMINVLKNVNLRIINHHKNRGYGAAVISGMNAAIGDIIITLDSDGQHNPEEIPRLIAPILKNEADIVIGSRYLGKSSYPVPVYTKIGEILISKFSMILFQQEIRNNQSGFRAFKRSTLSLFNDMMFNKFALCTEMCYKAALHEVKLKEVPITVSRRKYGTSYVNLLKLFINISACILIYALKGILKRFGFKVV